MRFHLTIVVGVLCFFIASGAATAQLCGEWLPTSGIAGVSYGDYASWENGEVNSLFPWDPDGSGPRSPVLMLGGRFYVAGDRWSPSIAGWDGVRWWSLPELGISSYQSPRLITAYAGSLYGVLYSNVVRWNGTSWQTVGRFVSASGGDSPPRLLKAGVNRLYAIGDFVRVDGVTSPSIVAWSGTAWNGLGAGIDWTVNTVADDADGVYVGGRDAIGPRVSTFVAGTWQSLSTGLASPGGSVDSLVKFNGRLWASGAMGVGSATSGRSSVASWDGLSWQPSVALLNGSDSRLHVIEDRLYATGSFTSQLRKALSHGVVVLDGNLWRLVGDGLPGARVLTLAAFGGSLVAGGQIYRAGNNPVVGVAAFSGDAWHALGGGIGHGVTALATSHGDPVAGGWGYVSRWSGGRWMPMGASIGSSIVGLAEYGGDLHVAGLVGQVDPSGRTGVGVLRWDGSAWRALSVNPPRTFSAGGMLVHRNKLVVFDQTSSWPEGTQIFQWDGSTWNTQMGSVSGVRVGSQYSEARIHQATEFQGDLVIVGSFFAAGGVPTRNVARWNGQSWIAMDNGLPESTTLYGVAEWQGDLYAMAYFTLWRWNGERWEVAVQPSYITVPSAGRLVRYGDDLFSVCSDGGIARCDGHVWQSVGSSWLTSGSGTAAVLNGELWLGRGTGTSLVDGRSLGFVSRWTNRPSLPRPALTSPAFMSVRAGSTTQFTLSVEGTGPFSFRWMHNGILINSGSTTLGRSVSASNSYASMRIGGTATTAAGEFAAEVINGCGFARSLPITLEVTCGADFTRDGRAGVEDLIAYLTAWFARDASADEDGYPTIGVNDLLLYITDFVAGCPE